ncbi:hypothetical protein M9458_053399 [Cirrhinus mrigala]|uniref:Uncharacterized protein n=1 Tax=Cirrhinus mrigala TaxID=683832 RepID=A0ABD0MM76_CIRMR
MKPLDLGPLESGLLGPTLRHGTSGINNLGPLGSGPLGPLDSGPLGPPDSEPLAVGPPGSDALGPKDFGPLRSPGPVPPGPQDSGPLAPPGLALRYGNSGITNLGLLGSGLLTPVDLELLRLALGSPGTGPLGPQDSSALGPLSSSTSPTVRRICVVEVPILCNHKRSFEDYP